MTDTNFHLAPPAKIVDGLLAVPIDIQRITAGLTFDGATHTGNGDATLEFTMGLQDGNPIFDLRQTITAAWLDGAPLSATKLIHHDFGGGVDAQWLIVESMLVAGSSHNLRVTYSLGLPQASMAGSYLPAITWTAGPRLAFNFGFTDLGAGRYLEAWVPANLVFDQFELKLELHLLNTSIAHTVITNGAVTPIGTNAWSISFPARYTALSPLLELRPADSLELMTGTATLPVSGATVNIEAWKLVGGPSDLATEITLLKGWLADNEYSTGPYMHGNRFVALLHVGGMEYEGGATSSVGALRHETFHSWWARGVKPASQPDSWLDEGWATYNDNGATQSFPFDFADPPVTLCPRNPWVRVTAPGSYASGNRFWEGVAALIGASTLRNLMGEFYRQGKEKPYTTADIEAFLIAHSGNTQLVDAFHRFIYGFTDPAPVPELWLRDDPAHTGTEVWTGRFWDSPDLWVRHADDGGTAHQSPRYGQENWFYARVCNHSTAAVARHFLVTFNVKTFAGTQFTYPADFLPCISAAAGFELGPGEVTIVKARWPAALVPPPGTHACLLATVLTRLDHPQVGRHVWEQNNLAQKNLTIVNLAPGEWIIIPFVVANIARISRRYQLELMRPEDQINMEVGLIHQSTATFKQMPSLKLQSLSGLQPMFDHDVQPNLDCGGKTPREKRKHIDDVNQMITSGNPMILASRFQKSFEGLFPNGSIAKIPVVMPPQTQQVFGLRLNVPTDAKAGEIIHIDVVQRDSNGKQILGGIAVEIHVR